MAKKILILYTSVGLGHKSIAENIGYHLERAGYEVKLFDALQLQGGRLVSIGTWVHQFINRRLPFVWRWLYARADRGWFARLTLPNRVKAASRNYRHIKQAIDEFQPDLVITTQTSASAVVQYLKQRGWYKNLFAIAFSDYHLHRYWLYDDADFYLVNVEEQKQGMVQLGIPPDKIFVLGITLRPRRAVDPVAVKQKLGIASEEQVILAASGSLGTGLSARWFTKLAKELAKLPKARLVILCGKNQQLYQALKGSNLPRTIVHSYYSPVAELYAIGDIFLSKPGGLTIAETLHWRLPVLITHWLPGGEELNYSYLIARQVILPKPAVVKPSSLAAIIKDELASRAFRESLISNPHARQLTQSGSEGHALVSAVKKAFHDV